MLPLTPPSCTRVHHTPGKGQGRVPRGVPLPRPSCSQVRDKLGGGPQPGSAPLSPARSETGRRIPSWALHPACHSPARWRQARESPAGPCVLPCRQALGPSCRNPLARVPSRRGREGKKIQSKHREGLANMALLQMEPRHPERPSLGAALASSLFPWCCRFRLLGAPSGSPRPGAPGIVLILKLPSRAPSFLLLSVPLSPFCVCGWCIPSRPLSELTQLSLRVCVWARRGVRVRAQAARGRWGEPVTAEGTGLLPWAERSPAAEGTSWGAGVSCRGEGACPGLPAADLAACSLCPLVPARLCLSLSLPLSVSASRWLSLSLLFPPSLACFLFLVSWLAFLRVSFFSSIAAGSLVLVLNRQGVGILFLDSPPMMIFF